MQKEITKAQIIEWIKSGVTKSRRAGKNNNYKEELGCLIDENHLNCTQEALKQLFAEHKDLQLIYDRCFKTSSSSNKNTSILLTDMPSVPSETPMPETMESPETPDVNNAITPSEENEMVQDTTSRDW